MGRSWIPKNSGVGLIATRWQQAKFVRVPTAAHDRPRASLPMQQHDIGLIGLAVMGQNLVLNMVNKGFDVAVYNRTTQTMTDFVAGSSPPLD